MSEEKAVWAKRLKEARLAAGISQKQLGIRAGLDPFVASTRINRYEQGIHRADYGIAQRIARELCIPTAFLYCDDDNLARMLLLLGRLNERDRERLGELAQTLADAGDCQHPR